MDKRADATADYITRRLGERLSDRRRARDILLICASTLILMVGLIALVIWAILSFRPNSAAVNIEIRNELHRILHAEVQQSFETEIQNEFRRDVIEVLKRLDTGGTSGFSIHQWRSDVFASGSAVAFEQPPPPCGDWLHCETSAAQPSPIEILRSSSAGSLVVLIGSHDAMRLRHAISKSIRTNPELAERRADTVRDEIATALGAKPSLKFIVLARPPEVGDRPLDLDRTVSVTLIDQMAALK